MTSSQFVPSLWPQNQAPGFSSAAAAAMYSHPMYPPHMSLPSFQPSSPMPPPTHSSNARNIPATEAGCWQQHMQMMAAMQQMPYGGQQLGQPMHPYMQYFSHANNLAASAHLAASSPSQPAPGAERGKKAHKKRHKDKHINERTKRKASKQHASSGTTTPHTLAPASATLAAATQPPYTTADPFHHPFAAQRSHHSSHGREGESERVSDVVMETNLEELFAPIPPLPDEVANIPTASERSNDREASGKEEKHEARRMDDIAPLHLRAVAHALDRRSTLQSSCSATLHQSKLAVPEERREPMTNLDLSGASESQVQGVGAVQALAQQAKDRAVERAVRQLPTRSLHATSRLLDRPAAYTIHQSLPPAPSAKLSLCTAVTTSDDTATTLHFSWPSLLSQVCSFLQREPTAEQLSVDECGAIGAFVSDEIGLHAVELSSEHIADFQHHMDDLLQYMLTKSAADVAVQRIIRFLRALGSSVYTVPLILSAALKALHTFMQLVQHAAQGQSSIHQPPASSSSLSSATTFISSHICPIVRSYHLCHLIESFVLLPPPPPVLLLTVTECVGLLHAVYEASLEMGVYGGVPLVCAYVWRIRSVVDGMSASEEADTVFEYVRREKTKQREAQVKKEDDSLL